jgi:hypothetical protein
MTERKSTSRQGILIAAEPSDRATQMAQLRATFEILWVERWQRRAQRLDLPPRFDPVVRDIAWLAYIEGK